MLLSKTILVLLLTSTVTFVFIQQVKCGTCEGDWSQIFDGGDLDYVSSVDQTSDGGYVFVGDTMSYGAGYTDVWLVKTDFAGDHVWNRTFGTPAYDKGCSIQQTTDGGYIVTGYCDSSGSGFKNCKLWLIKTDGDGQSEWNRTFSEVYYEGSNETVLWSEGYSAKQTSDCGYIIAGSLQPRSDRSEAIWLIKTDASGNKVWEHVFHGGGTPPYWIASASSVQQTIDGGYIIAGRKDGEAKGDIWLIKTTTTGTPQWNKTYGKEYVDPYSSDEYPGNERAYSVQQTLDGGYIIAGKSASNYDQRGWVIKTDAFGDKMWEIAMKPDTLTCAAQQTRDSGYILFGSSKDKYGNACVWLAKTDADGNKLWEKLTGDWEVCIAQDALQTNDGSYIIVADVKAGLAPGKVWLVHTCPLWTTIFTQLSGHPIVDLAFYNGNLHALSDNVLCVYDDYNWSIIDAPTYAFSLEPYEDKLIVGGKGGLYFYNGTIFTLIFTVSRYIKPLGVYNNILYAGTILDNPPTLYYCNGSVNNPDNWHVDNIFLSMLNFSGPFGSIESFATYNNNMYVSCGSTVYSFNGTVWDIAKTYGDAYAFLDMEVYNDKLYLATRDSATRCPTYQGGSGFCGRVIEFDGNDWTVIFNHTYWIFSLETFDSKLYAGTTGKIYAFDGLNWSVSLNITGGAYYAISLTTYNNSIYAGMGNGCIFADPLYETKENETVAVPELPSFIILPLLLLATFVVVLIKKKKRVP